MATYIEGALKKYLTDATAVSTICSARVYHMQAPPRVTKPYVFFYRVSDPHQAMYFDDTGDKTKAGQARFQFSCVSSKPIVALNLQKTVMQRLRWASGTINSYVIETISIENMRQRIDPETKDNVYDVDVICEYFE